MNSTHQQHWKRKRFCFLPLLVIGLFAVSAVVMFLWNSIIPGISSLSAITYWQAMGLFVLSRILFGGFRCMHGHHRSHHAEFRDRFMEMSDEEKQQFKNQWKQRCCK
jgi:hypothetical protein